MELVEVRSSNISAVGYDPDSRTLRVRFHGDAEWDYSSVPPETFKAMVEAESIGKHFRQNIKANYACNKAS